MFKIVKKEILAEKINLYEIQAPRVAKKALPGQFVIVRIDERGERIPLTIADFNLNEKTITLVVQEVGFSTEQMGKLKAGAVIKDLAGPLGRPSEIPQGKTILAVAGGLGIAPLFPIARALKKAKNTVISIIGAKNKNLLFWQDKMQSVSDKLLIATDDGSAGHKGFVTEVLKQVIDKTPIDTVIAIGPAIMMYAVSKVTPPETGLVVSLNSLMIDGTGMCGGCRVSVGGETKFTCVDGPEFDGHKVDFQEFLDRHKIYKEEEQHICKIGLEKNN